MPLTLIDTLNLLAIFTAGLVRGYAGFGFAAISIGLISLWRSPSDLVPIIFLLEIPASLLMLRSALRDFSWVWIKPLIGGSIIGIPIGVGLLASISTAWLQLMVGATICTASTLVRLGWHPQQTDSKGFRWLTGLVSGVLNGLSALGGIVCAVMLYSAQVQPKVWRATLTLLFLFTDVYALALAYWSGLIQSHTWSTALVWSVPLALGIFAGSRVFHGSNLDKFRDRVFLILIGLGITGLVKAVWALLS